MLIIPRIICDALGLGHLAGQGNSSITPQPSFKKNIIVEAEMVAFSDALDRIDGTILCIHQEIPFRTIASTEFWRIRSIIATTAVGVRHKNLTVAHPPNRCSM